MARPGVTYLDVTQAAEAIRQQGHNPTVDRVLAHLGTGSKSTLAPLLKRWKAEQGDGADTGSLPNDVVAAVKALHERLQQGADDKITQAQEEYRSRAAELRAQLTEAERTIRQLQAGRQALQQRVEALQDENKGLCTESEAERVKTAKLEAVLGESSDRLSDAKATIQAQQQEIRQVRTHLEHYQTSVAEDRQQERAQLQSNQTQWESRLRDLSQQLKEAAGRYRTLEAANQRTEADLVKLREAFDEAKQDQQALQLDATRQDEVLKQRTAETAALREQVTTLETRCEAIAKDHAELTSKARLSAHDAARLQQQLSEGRDTIHRLTDEHRRMAEVKAVLEGRLKEIRSTV